MVLDLALMLRILGLKLHRTYVFIALFALLNLLYDGVGLALNTQSEDFSRVVFVSRFVFAVVYPLVLWDLFEEATPIIDKLRKFAVSRMINSMVFICIWGLLIAAFTSNDTDRMSYVIQLSVIVWTGSVAAALAFLWVMRKGVKLNNFVLPHNTTIWTRYFAVILIIEACSCVLLLVLSSLHGAQDKFSEPIAQIGDSVFGLCEIALTAWCVLKLRPANSDASNVPAKVSP